MARDDAAPEHARPAAQPRRSVRVASLRWARRARWATFAIGVTAVLWFFWKFDTRWVPAGMDTVPTIPPGSWVVVDSTASGLAVGSDVFVETPHGVLLSRVAELRADEVVIAHPNPRSGWVDSAVFGPLPRSAVRGVVAVVFAPADAAGGGGDGR